MTDRELLEAAAKAAGYTLQFKHYPGYILPRAQIIGTLDYWTWWNPLNDDGDRYKLVKALRLNLDFADQCVWKRLPDGNLIQEFWHEEGDSADPELGDEPHAVLRAAAKLGSRK